MLKIKEFAVLCKCKVYTLRFYDKIGLLKPSKIDVNSGYRYYTNEQLDDYLKIRQLQEVGFTIEELKLFNQLNNSEIIDALSKKIAEMGLKIEKAEELKEVYLNKLRAKSN